MRSSNGAKHGAVHPGGEGTRRPSICWPSSAEICEKLTLPPLAPVNVIMKLLRGRARAGRRQAARGNLRREWHQLLLDRAIQHRAAWVAARPSDVPLSRAATLSRSFAGAAFSSRATCPKRRARQAERGALGDKLAPAGVGVGNEE